MNIVLALTQLIFLALGTVFLKGIVNANGAQRWSPYISFVNQNWPWFFLVPVVWIVLNQIFYQINKGPFSPLGARVLGVVLSGLCLAYFASVLFFPGS